MHETTFTFSYSFLYTTFTFLISDSRVNQSSNLLTINHL